MNDGNVDEFDNLITKNPLRVVYGTNIDNIDNLPNLKKASGADITMTYDILQMSIPNNPTVEYLQDLYAITNKYQINSVLSNNNYEPYTKAGDNNGYSLNYLPNINAIFILNFVDDAGNTFSKAIVTDFTSPKMMYRIIDKNGNFEDWQELTNANNYLKTNAEVNFGQYKAIKVDSNIIDNLVNFATSGDVCIKNDSTNNYLLVKIDKKSIKIGNEEKTTNNQIETITADKELSYEFTSKDIVKNSAMGKIIVNFDNVELKALMYGDHPKNIQNIGDLNFSSDDNTPDSNNNDIADGDITTLQHLKLQWLANDEKFIVKKVEYEYYPFDFNTIFINDNNNYNPNYPFSISPQFSEILFEGNTGTGELNGDCFVTNYINLSTGNKDFSGGTATKQGMYVVTRTYDHDKFVQAVQEKLNNGETELDTEVRKYYFYIDRNNIITQINDRLVTNNISILMGSGDDQSSFADLEFFNDILNAKGNIFETNKQPIELNIPLTKYKTYGQTFEGFVYNYNTTTTSYDYTSYKFFFMPNATGKYTNGNATIYIKNQSNNDTQTYNCTYVVRTENAVPTIVITYGNNNQITATFTNGNAINNSIALNATIGEYNVYAKKQTQNMIYYNYSINNNLVNESFAGSKTTNNAIAKLDKNTLTYELHVSDISPEFVGGDTSRSFKNNYYNSLIFQYEINLKNPTAKFVDSSGFQTSENQNSTDVKLIWNKYDPYFDFNANIDANNISITKQTYTNGQIFTSVIPNFRATSTESVAYIYFSDIEVPTESTKYIVTLQYKNASYYGEFSKSTNTLNVDLNAPYYNYSNLFYNDSFLQQLSSSEIANFKNYSADINFENYAFVVEEGWELKIPTASDIYSENSRIIYDKLFVDSSDLDALDKYDVAYAWYRAYDKAYTGTNPEYMQSIVPGDDRYYDRSVPNYKFDANLTNEQNEKIYSQYLFGTTILSAGSYYEIIEKDISGNYRVYTIYVTDQNVRTITFELDEGYTIEKMTDDNTYLVTTTNMDASINQVNIADQTEINSLVSSPLIIKSIDGLGAYYDVTIQNLATKGNVVQIRKSKASDILTQINSAISTNFNYGKEGNNFKITFYSASGTYVVNYRTESELDIIFNSSTCTLTFTVDKTYGSYIKTLQVLQNGIRVYTIGENDTNKPYTITTSSTSTKTTYMLRFDLNQNMGSQLKFTFTDNFDKFNQRFVVLGIENTSFDYVDSDTTGSNMLIFGNDHTSTDYDKIENPTPITTLEYDEFTKVSEFYTGLDTVSFRYQTRVYSNVKFYEYKNETLTELKNLRSSTSNTNYKNITQLFNNKKENVDDVYVITFIDPVGNVYEYIIHHYTKLADITFEDVDNNAVDFEEQAVPQLTKIYTMYVENQPEKYQTTITATRNSVSNGMSWTTNLGTIRSGYAFSVTGTYVVTAKNSIGTTKTFIFSYTETDNYFYTITANANGVTRIIYPSSNLKFNYNGNLIDQYFALNSETISISVGNDYEFEEIASMTSNSTKIYQLTSKTVVSFSKLFAITQIRSTTDLLLGKFYIDNKQVSASKISAQSISEIVTITIPSYYSDKTNKLVLSVTYNNKLIGKINGVLSPDEEYMTYSFDVAGDYTISVSDQAGNIHLFNGTTQKFALSVLNDVIYKINSKDPIKNSYYNSSVILNVLSINKFYADKNQPYVTESVTLNNVQIDTTRYNKINNGTYYTYTFDEYGSYVVTFTAYIGSVAEQNKVSTTATFTIINPNEAKRVHEYIGLNGYQVNSIIKDNVDVTNVIKNKIGTATLNQFALFGGTGNNVIGGNGRYTITVNAYLGNILGYQEFTYSVWINDDTSALIESSIQPGSSTTKTIYLKMNLYQIYSKIGDCTIKLNGKKYITINSSTASSNTISTYELKSNQKYNITVETESGNTLLSFVVTKKEPLNTVAIIVIVVVSVVATGLTVTFILFRKRMRVK